MKEKLKKAGSFAIEVLAAMGEREAKVKELTEDLYRKTHGQVEYDAVKRVAAALIDNDMIKED